MSSSYFYFAFLITLSVLSANAQDPTPTPSPHFDCPDKEDRLFPDPNDCSKYFVCTNGLAWHESCAPGLLFDPILLFCNWPDEVNCQTTGSPVITTATPTTTSAPVTSATPVITSGAPDTEGTTSPDLPSTPASEGTTSSDFPSSSVTEDPVTDVPTSTAEPPSSAPTNPPSSAPTDPPTNPPPTTPSSEFKCPNNNPGTYPHPTDCAAYYVCDNGVAYPERCPDPLFYDPDLQVCNWEQFVDCDRFQKNIS